MCLRFACLAVALLGPIGHAAAQDESAAQAGFGERFRVSGFGTAGFSAYSSEVADYVGTQQPDGPGRTGETSGSLDSNLGVQLDAQILPQLSATLQVLSEYLPEGNWDPRVSVGSLRWEASDQLALRVGRFQSSTFLATDYRYVRFANAWPRPPREVYGVQPTTRLDGADLSWQMPLRDGRLMIRAGGGEVTSGAVASTAGASDEIVYRGGFLRAQWEAGSWLASASLAHNRVTFAPSGVVGQALQLLAKLDPAAGEAAIVDDKPNTALALGLAYDSETWFVQAEWARAWNDSILIDRSGAYLQAGHRFGRALPYLMLAERWTHGQKIRSGIPAAEALLRVLYRNQHSDQRSATLGVNVELFDRAMLKGAIEWVRPASGGTGLQGNIGPGYSRESPKSERLFTLNLDFVF
ncbi:hypothetical protein OPU71_17060 [Niveibacterium sp. 24ML]|uniref:hypothetical protein n=1 Tax=Niveibacterium sp. 24ML TaxID=2985512 RepID=UPI002271F69E|nr:hypothetical protein [Niveibacterium sp. 24ML]MCX9157836.1 hypothetical protein [Niveibacterium sp. 24ML]